VVSSLRGGRKGWQGQGQGQELSPAPAAPGGASGQEQKEGGGGLEAPGTAGGNAGPPRPRSRRLLPWASPGKSPVTSHKPQATLQRAQVQGPAQVQHLQQMWEPAGGRELARRGSLPERGGARALVSAAPYTLGAAQASLSLPPGAAVHLWQVAHRWQRVPPLATLPAAGLSGVTTQWGWGRTAGEQGQASEARDGRERLPGRRG